MHPAPYDPGQPQPYGQQPPQPYQPAPYAAGWQQQAPPVQQAAPMQQPPQQVVNVYAGGVAPGHYRRRGLSGGANAVHAILSVCTAGLWLPIWFLHWLASR